MKQQEDIGSLIKEKLQMAEKVSNDATWDRIQQSMEERKKKRRFAFYIKLGSAGLIVLIGALVIMNYSNSIDENTSTSKDNMHIEHKSTNALATEGKELKNVDTPETITTTSSKKSTKERTPEELYQEVSTQSKTTSTEVTPEVKNTSLKTEEKFTSATIRNTKKKVAKTNSSVKKDSKTTMIDTVVNRNDVPVTQTTQKIHYYYNSKTGQEVSSTDKRVIDSIMKANQVKSDSLNKKN
ncbi:hypothetical protein [uncultured Dokdonia sp.]|uniref:hypothetical protein n=1 Tax=uncultured Dokdonia sp. TaxID=575653 RepID=UPI00260F7DE2|nr:hypothetical protein [uncultured Dokdonia sp.]